MSSLNAAERKPHPGPQATVTEEIAVGGGWGNSLGGGKVRTAGKKERFCREQLNEESEGGRGRLREDEVAIL